MNYFTLFNNISGDNVLITSSLDYFESLITHATEVQDILADIISHAGEEGYTIPSIDGSLVYNVNNRVYSIDTEAFAHALFNDEDEYHEVINDEDITVNVESVMSQLSDSLITNKVMTESLRVLRDASTDTVASMTSLLSNRLRFRLGELTETASNLGTKFLEILTQQNVSVGSRVREVLKFIGLYNWPDEVTPDIGLPKSNLEDITGMNVYQAWAVDLPKNLPDVIPWLHRTVSKAVNFFSEMTKILLGSSAYRAIKHFFGRLSGQSDSFSFTDDANTDASLGSHGYSALIDINDYDVPWISTDLNIIFNILKTLARSGNIDNQIANIYQGFDLLLYMVTGSYVQNDSAFKALLNNMDDACSMPDWLAEYSIEPDGTIYGNCAYCYAIIVGKYYGSVSLEQLSLFDMVSSILGALLDVNHINDNSDLTLRLESNSYLRFDLPCSSIYMWLVGSQIYYTRRITPYSIFANVSTAEKPYPNPGDILLPMMGWENRSTYPGTYDWALPMKKFNDFINRLRTSNNEDINYDYQMRNALFCANVVDSVFISVFEQLVRTGKDPFQYDTSNMLFGSGYGRYPNEAFEYFDILTGYSGQNYLDKFYGYDSNKLTNRVICDMTGALNPNGKYDESDDHGAFFAHLISLGFNADDVFVPYCHQLNIDTGRYRIITDSELGDVTSTLIKISTIIIAAVVTLVAVKNLKKKSLAARTKAEAKAWDAVTKGQYDQQAINEQFKLHKRANRIDILASGLFKTVGDGVKMAGSSIASIVSTTVTKMKNLTAGNRVNPSSNDPVDLSYIVSLIIG